MTDLDIAKIKEAAEKAKHRWSETDVILGGNPHVIENQFDFVNACNPTSVLALIARLEASEARVKTLERMDREAATHVESVICMKSKHFTGEAPYIGWKGLGLALTQDYDALKAAEARNATAYAEGVEAAAKVLQAMKPEYNDGPSMHVENMTLGRAVLTIRALLKDKPNG